MLRVVARGAHDGSRLSSERCSANTTGLLGRNPLSKAVSFSARSFLTREGLPSPATLRHNPEADRPPLALDDMARTMEEDSPRWPHLLPGLH